MKLPYRRMAILPAIVPPVFFARRTARTVGVLPSYRVVPTWRYGTSYHRTGAYKAPYGVRSVQVAPAAEGCP
jgi:hypothetical protein